MRSFMKSHRRDNSEELETETVGPVIESLLPPQNPSPAKNVPGSPTSSKSNKLQRLFLRSKNSTQNLQGFNILPPVSSKNNISPSIIGTRTHEWGTASPRNSSSKNTRESFESAELSNASATSASNDQTSNNEEPALLSPLDTVPEIPLLSTNNSSALEAHQKSIRRRAKIFTKDWLEEDSIIYPNNDSLENIKELEFDKSDDKTHDKCDDITVNGQLLDYKQRKHDENHSISGDSEFSFEQDTKAGRNMSIRYYKSPQEEAPQSDQHLPGFYVNDLVDDDFDDDMNYFNEDDEFNDDEELFNRKYFSDDDEDYKKITVSTNMTADNYTQSPHTPIDQIITSPDIPSPVAPSQKNSSPDDINGLENAIHNYSIKPRRSLKYYQISKDLDQEYDAEKHLYFEEENVNTHERNKSNGDSIDSYDSLLDEINNVPEDFEFEIDENNNHNNEHTLASKSRPKSLNSSLSKITKGTVFENSYQNSKFTTNDKTVTLFNRSRQNSLKSQNEQTSKTPEKHIYSTPNGSFTTPSPAFIKESNLELSPISEYSIDESP